MIVIILAAAIGLTMIVLSVRANSRFRQEQKLPMQWMLSRSRPLSSTVIWRSEEHTSELQSLMRISYAVFCLKKKKAAPTIVHYTVYIARAHVVTNATNHLIATVSQCKRKKTLMTLNTKAPRST